VVTLRTANFNIQELRVEPTEYSYGLYEPHKKQRLFPYTA